MFYKIALFVFGIGLVVGCSTTVQQSEVKRALEITDQSRIKPIAITKVAAKIRRGTVVGKLSIGLFCVGGEDIKWRSGNKVFLSSEDLVDVFREELEAHGWPVVGSTEDLFQGYDVSGAEVLVAARITALKSKMCAPMAGFGNWDTKGSMRMDVEWQVYSPARRSLIGKVNTEGSAEIKKPNDDISFELLSESFSVAANNLLASETFLGMVGRSQGLMDTPDSGAALALVNETHRYITMQAAIEAAKRSTVTVRTAQGHGSGFAIGDGSYVLTNSHVVGEAQTVSIVTSGGLTLNGSVTKMSRERDVALIEIDGLRLPALHVNPQIPDTGSQVLAIGSPLDEQLSGSVTSGIVSGTRTMEGQRWIQSDTAISPGNSGGPLLDSYGSVVGISTAGFQIAGSQIGLNLFIPISEALVFVGLKVNSPETPKRL